MEFLVWCFGKFGMELGTCLCCSLEHFDYGWLVVVNRIRPVLGIRILTQTILQNCLHSRAMPYCIASYVLVV